MKNFLAVIAAIAIAMVAGFYIFSEKLPADRSEGKADIGGPFSLIDQDGKVFTEQNLKGKYSLVFFGFTNCPEVCPTTLMETTEAIKKLGDDAKNLLPIFISIDSNDNPTSMKTYLTNFHPSIIGLTGSEEQIKKAAAAYKVYYAKINQPESSAGYTMDHSAYVYFMDKDGNYLTHFSYKDPADKIISTVKPYLD